MHSPVEDVKGTLTKLRQRITELEQDLEIAVAERDQLRQEVRLLRQIVRNSPTELFERIQDDELRRVCFDATGGRDLPTNSYYEPADTDVHAHVYPDYVQGDEVILMATNDNMLPDGHEPQVTALGLSSPRSSLASFASLSQTHEKNELRGPLPAQMCATMDSILLVTA
ncbi:hypothetical protein BDY17DRAFT_306246, partial [Neohortaea acidophila]